MITKTARKKTEKARCAPAAGSAAGWKCCAEEMPDSDLTVLIANPIWPDDPVWIGYHDGDVWRDIDNMRLNSAPTHWMDFPAPPSGDGKRQSEKLCYGGPKTL
jgi:hypothetical protein